MNASTPDFSDIKGLHKEVMECARATLTFRRILLVTHGFGAVMIASRLNGLRPELAAIERALLAGTFQRAGMQAPKTRPFRAPHCSSSIASILGQRGKPGEVQLARHGTLFLNDVLDFRRHVIQGIGRNIDNSTTLIASTPVCGCINGFRPSECICGDRVKASIERHKERVIKDLGITAVITLPFRSQSDRVQAEPNPDTATLIKMIMHGGATATTAV
mgnify:CR=1 FL=1|tara:strand:- start:13540 stop:14193 length:654 start_codon:yes stop_codon:yes gene_type:complete